VAWLVTPILQQIAAALGSSPLQWPQLPALEEIAPRTLSFFEHHPALNIARQGLALLFLVAAVGLVFWWAVRRFGRLARHDVDEVRDSIATPELLLTQLRSLLRRQRRRPASGPPFLALTGARDDPRLMVRRAYQSMLAWAQSFSLPRRRAGETPLLYAATLSEVLPAGQAAFQSLTGAYLQARYGAQPPTLAQARAAQSALAELQALGASLIRPKSRPVD
jgi:hypothetical protein